MLNRSPSKYENTINLNQLFTNYFVYIGQNTWNLNPIMKNTPQTALKPINIFTLTPF